MRPGGAIAGLALIAQAAGAQQDTPAPAPPAWEARVVVADARLVAEQIILVRPGEGLIGIAAKTGASAEAIVRANALTPPYALRVNQRLRIPGGRYHLVKPGETGIGIARAYGVDWSRVVTANALGPPYALRSGQRILIPAPLATTPRSRAAERAAAFRLDIDDIVTGIQPARPATRRPPALPARMTSGFTWPVEGGRIVTRFGAGGTGERSDGIGIAVPVGTPVRASADGVIAYAGTGIAALGGLIVMRHGGGWTSVYGHAARLLVTRGQRVVRGQVIATTDRSAFHFQLRRGRTPVDPLTLLPRR